MRLNDGSLESQCQRLAQQRRTRKTIEAWIESKIVPFLGDIHGVRSLARILPNLLRHVLFQYVDG